MSPVGVSVAEAERLRELRGRTLWQLLSQTTERDPEHEAIVAWDDDREESRVTYGEVLERARALSAGLVAAGVRAGDRVAVQMTNRPEFIFSYFAIARIGAVAVPINTRFAAGEVAYVLRDSRARYLITLDRFRSVDFHGMLDTIVSSWRSSQAGALHDSGAPELRTIVSLMRDGAGAELPAAALDLRALIGEDAGEEAIALATRVEHEVRPDDLAMIKYTSGSTGFPKGAMLEHGGLIADGLLHTERLELDSSDRWFGNPPLFHVAGSIWGLMSCVTRGATFVFGETFDPDVTLEMVQRERCTVIFGVPTVLRDIISHARQRDTDLSSVRLMGGGLDPSLAAAMREVIPSLTTTINGFGLTEAYGTSACPGPQDPPELQATTCGRLYPGIEHRVVDHASGNEVAPGVTGELWLRGLVTSGYWDDPENTAAVLDEDGWLHTGDLVSVDERRYLVYRGRIKTMLKIGGENVAVEEVERVILEHPKVQDGVVVGVPDERRDEVAYAYVLPEPDAIVEEQELVAWCSERLARFKVPERFVVVAEMPRIGSGKIDRVAVARVATAGSAG
ncbi:MAG TPA: AMP-binding protein [Solirubrobacteraceae bacterium]|jgi:fatty-acyl-CoA synthase|nr:AMP-binding protein [Solirubrobacteraceae bacterium]